MLERLEFKINNFSLIKFEKMGMIVKMENSMLITFLEKAI